MPPKSFKKLVPLLFCFLFQLVSVTLYAEEALLLKFSLKEAVLQALKNNYDIKFGLVTPQIVLTDIQAAEGAFDPQLQSSLSASRRKSLDPSSRAANGTAVAEAVALTASLSKRFKTGSDLALNYSGTYGSQHTPFTPFYRQYDSEATLRLTQDLLKDYGRNINETPIQLAFFRARESYWQTTSTVLRIVTSTILAYNNLHLARQNVDIQKKSKELSEELLARKKEEVDLGALASVQLVAIEGDIVQKESNLVAAQLQADTAEVDLKALMGLPIDFNGSKFSLLLLDEPKFNKETLNPPQYLKIALCQNPDLQGLYQGLKYSRLNYRFSDNQRLPKLQVFGGGGFNNTNNLKSRNSLFPYEDEDRNSLEAGITLSYPWDNNLAEATYRRANLQLKQDKRGVERLIFNIKAGLDYQLANLTGLAALVESAQRNTDKQKENLASEKLKLDSGLSDIRNVLIIQDILIQSELQYISALVSYQNAFAQLNQLQGIIDPSLQIELMSYTREYREGK